MEASDSSPVRADDGVIEPPKTDSSFLYPEYAPTQTTPQGVKFDFNCGFRLQMPDSMDRPLRVRLVDEESGCLLHDSTPKAGARIASTKKYRVKYRLEIGTDKGELLFTHRMRLDNQHVLVQMPLQGAIGDSIAWFSMCDRFRQQTGCLLHVLMPPHISVLFQDQYPKIQFETRDSAGSLRPYATFYLGLFFGGDEDWQPYDFRLLGLAETAGSILGVENLDEIPPKVKDTGTAHIEEPYVCIGVQASSHAKHWCRPDGWRTVAKALVDSGYRVLCIDRERDVGAGNVWHSIPNGVEDWTGNRPLQERVDLLLHAKCFIGLSSGLSWLAWCCGIPVVRISGICAPWGEFQTPYNVQCRHTCHGCWNDTRYEFDHHDFMWCPKHRDTPREYECTKFIGPEMVLEAASRALGVELGRTYWPGVFDVKDKEGARRIILTPQSGQDTDYRWEHETPALVELLRSRWTLSGDVRVVDFGCGIGRLSRELCRLGCSVVGVDISESMRKLAVDYVGSDKFKAVSPGEFDTLLASGTRFDYGCAVWVLQHCQRPDAEVSRLYSALKPGGELFVLNNKNTRALPVKSPGVWYNDGIDVWNICKGCFGSEEIPALPAGAGLDPACFQAAFYGKA